MTLQGKTVAIIGGTSGIGRATAEAAAAAGATVIIGARTAGKVEEAARAIGGRGMAVDTTQPESLANFFREAGRIDHLVLPGSSINVGSFQNTAIDDAIASMHSKFFGQYAAVRAADVAPDGSVVLFSGAASRMGGGGLPALTAINAAVEALGKALAAALAPVRVNVMCPGVVDTEIWVGTPEVRAATLAGYTAKQPVHRPGRPEEIAQGVLFLLTSSYVTGTVLDIDGGALVR